jgi:hypothetical protein
VQYHEDSGFVKLFDAYGGLTYLNGGVASGFKAIDRSKGVQLYQVKGRRNPVLLQVAPTGSSLNQGDAFILTSDTAVFLWIGSGANIREKQKAASVADALKAKFKGVPFTRLDGGETTPAFWALLGGPVAIAASAGADDSVEAANVKKIFKVDGANFTLVAEGAAAVPGLLKGGTFIVLRGEEIVVFIGRGTPPALKKGAIDLGVRFLAAQRLPSYYAVSVALEGVESSALTVIFA